MSITQPNMLIQYFTAYGYLIALFFHSHSNTSSIIKYIIFTTKNIRATTENRLHFSYQHKKICKNVRKNTYFDFK